MKKKITVIKISQPNDKGQYNWNKWAVIAQIPILLIMTWATVENYYMRRASQEQTEKSTIPVIIFDINTKNYFYSEPIIKNIGYGPAFNISLSDIDHREYQAWFDEINGLESGGIYFLEYSINCTDNKLKSDSITSLFNSFLSYRGYHNMGRYSVENIDTLTLKYSDIKGNVYEIMQTIKFDISKNKIITNIIKFPEKK